MPLAINPGLDLILHTDPRARSLLNGLVAYWPLDEAGGTRRDLSGNGLTLTDNNSALSAAGPSSKLPVAASLAAVSNQTLSRADNALFSMGAGRRMTFQVWAYLATKPASVMLIASQWLATGNLRAWHLFWDNVTDRFIFGVSADGTGATTDVSANNFGAPATGTWYLVTVRYDGAVISISVNNGTPDTTAFTADIFNSTADLLFGSQSAGQPGVFWNGRQAGVPFWTRAITNSEVEYMYNGGNGRRLIPGRGFV